MNPSKHSKGGNKSSGANPKKNPDKSKNYLIYLYRIW